MFSSQFSTYFPGYFDGQYWLWWVFLVLGKCDNQQLPFALLRIVEYPLLSGGVLSLDMQIKTQYTASDKSIC